MTDRHIRRSGADYAIAFLNLLPQGQAWSRDLTTVQGRVYSGLAQYWGFVDGRAADLLERESDPRATLELLPDWEHAWGLPDLCMKEPLSIADRRIALAAKMTMLGGQSRQFFINLAAALGYTIFIREYSPYMTGVSRCGDTRALDRQAGGDGTFDRWQLGSPDMRFYWTVKVTQTRLTWFRCGVSQTGIDRLLRIGLATDLECILDRYAPAHTPIIYDYSPLVDLDFSQRYNNMYLALGII
jgi:uncharacterized protein YmfQ (DUF2313 family)